MSFPHSLHSCLGCSAEVCSVLVQWTLAGKAESGAHAPPEVRLGIGDGQRGSSGQEELHEEIGVFTLKRPVGFIVENR